MSFHFKPVLLAAIVSQTFPALAADPIPQAYQELNEVKVIGGRKVQKLGEEKIRRQALDKQMVSDESDLVRYDPGISVVEGGRSGSNGFTIRGVDKDRVAINVDGLAQAESRSSEAFQELFGAYGNFNANRNTSEPENFSEVTLTKGADSLKSGSGALGGALSVECLMAKPLSITVAIQSRIASRISVLSFFLVTYNQARRMNDIFLLSNISWANLTGLCEMSMK